MNSTNPTEALVAAFLTPGMLKNFGLLALLLIVALVLKIALGRGKGPRSNRNRNRKRDEAGQDDLVNERGGKSGIYDPAVQLEAISHVEFETQPLLNAEEEPILSLLETEANALGAGYRVMAQTSMGEIVRPKPQGANAEQRQMAFRAINSKRLDFAVFNQFGKLVLALEYQGSGHYRRTSFMRDAVKREVLRKANVPLLAVEADYDAAEVAASVRKVLGDHLAKTGQKRHRVEPPLSATGAGAATPLAAPEV